jgi:hypothetical protein
MPFEVAGDERPGSIEPAMSSDSRLTSAERREGWRPFLAWTICRCLADGGCSAVRWSRGLEVIVGSLLGRCSSRRVRSIWAQLSQDLTNGVRQLMIAQAVLQPLIMDPGSAQTACAEHSRTPPVHPHRERLSTSIRLARSAWLLVALIVSYSWLPAAGLADEFERTHSREIQEMVAANVRMETGVDAIYNEFIRKVRSDPDLNSPSRLAERRLDHDCSYFIYARFYAKYRTLIDNIDTSSSTLADLRKDRSDESILRDPQKIAFELKYRISVFQSRKDFHPPQNEFVVQYSTRPDLEAKCTHYLDLTGLRN